LHYTPRGTHALALTHVDGTISMARDGADSTRSDFFLCVGNQPELDFGGRRNADGQGLRHSVGSWQEWTW